MTDLRLLSKEYKGTVTMRFQGSGGVTEVSEKPKHQKVGYTLMSITNQLKNLRRAAMLIALDNGMINRGQTELEFMETTDAVLARAPLAMLCALDAFLGELSGDELQTACCGEYHDAADVLIEAPDPRFASHVLECVFNEEWEAFTDG